MNSLQQWDKAKAAIAIAATVDEVKEIRDQAQAMLAYLKQAKESLVVQNQVAEIKLRSERKAGELLKETQRHKGGNPNLSHRATGCNGQPTLPEMGLTRSQSSRYQQMADLDESLFEQHIEETKAKNEELTTASVLKAVRSWRHEQATAQEEAKMEAVNAVRKKDLRAVCDLRVSRCRDLLTSGIQPDAVITDPPYPKEFLPVFSELAESCKAAQVPLVAVMSGQSYLPEVMQRLSEHLDYRWTLAYLTPGGQAVQQWQAKVNTFWKPVLLFGEAKEWLGDVTRSDVNDNDKRYHEWGQSESGMLNLVERLTQPGDLVCDPFVGGGATAVAALQLGRHFVGGDIDAEAIEKTRRRVEVL